MNENDQHLINCIEFIVRRIVREELSESNQNEINIEDYRDEIEDIVQQYVKNEIEDIVQDYVSSNLSVTVELG